MGNIALNKTATASSYVKPYTPSKAVDGAITPFSRWLCNTLPCWISVDIGLPVWINRWVVRHMPVVQGWPTPAYVNCDFKLQGSLDNSTWINIDLITGNTLSVTDRTVTPVCFRFYRVTVTKGLTTNPQLASIMELEIYSAPPTSNYLSGLTLSSGTLSPAFSKTNYSYTTTVANGVSSLSVTPTAEDTKATIKVNGTVVSSGTASPAIPLSVGTNTITVAVTALIGGGVSTYTITVTRQDSAYLSSLTAQSGSTLIQLNPTFIKTTAGYTASVDYTVANMTFTPTAESKSATITINGTAVASGKVSPSFNLAEGNNTYSIVVTSGGATFTYTVVIARAYNLLLNKADIAYIYRGGSGSTTVTMNGTNLNYSVNLPNNPSSMTIAPFAQSTNTVIKVNGIVVPSGTPSVSIPVTSGMVVPITVSSTDNTQTRSYTLTITK